MVETPKEALNANVKRALHGIQHECKIAKASGQGNVSQ